VVCPEVATNFIGMLPMLKACPTLSLNIAAAPAGTHVCIVRGTMQNYEELDLVRTPYCAWSPNLIARTASTPSLSIGMVLATSLKCSYGHGTS
jgi:hypothetical protein